VLDSNGLRDGFRIGFLEAVETRIRNLTKMGKNVIWAGDLNVSRDTIDTARAEESMTAEGMTHDQYLSTPNRRIFNQLLLNGKVPGQRDEGREEPVLYDLCREFHPEREGMFTHWEQKINARPGNFGSRIDFILCSLAMKDWFKEANIQEGLMGSDHCPVYAVTKDKVPTTEFGEERHVLDLLNPADMFKDGVRLREYDPAKDILPLSGKLLTEFTKRRSIRDMFSKKPALSETTSTPMPTMVETSTATEVDVAEPIPAAATEPDKELEPGAATATSSAAIGIPILSQTPLKSAEKRRASASASPIKPVKRGKSNASAAPSKASKGGQQSLKGFFQPKTKAADPSPTKDTAPASPAANGVGDSLSQSTASMPSPSPSAAGPITSEFFDSDPRASQEASKASWTKLFSKKPSPRCEHGEPCITLTTKKPGVNCGRQFWICPRPIGPSGQKEVGTQWRCGTFIWSSDWKGS
jgi:AP endonuclease-2